MCNHIWRTVNDVRVCMRCGMTVRLLDGAILFDRKLRFKTMNGFKVGKADCHGSNQRFETRHRPNRKGDKKH